MLFKDKGGRLLMRTAVMDEDGNVIDYQYLSYPVKFALPLESNGELEFVDLKWDDEKKEGDET